MLDKLIQAIRDIASENPDFVYQRKNGMCMYAIDDDELDAVPDCIVGHALVKIGFSSLELLDQDGYFDEVARNDPEWNDLFSRDQTVREFDEKLGFIKCVQEHQDTKTSWSESVKSAEEFFKNV